MATEEDRVRRPRRAPLFPRSEPPRLDQPRALRRSPNLRPQLDSDKFGQWSEDIARFFGTARYLGIQSMIVIIWIALNILVWTRTIRWDPYPFILLNLAFSTQAAYAAPLILLAQNRQADRDKVQIEQDRQREEQSIANTEYLAREVAALRLAVNEVATRDFVRSELQALLKEMDGTGPGHEAERRRAGAAERGSGQRGVRRPHDGA
jgi:uncharacterized membrane protein